jgi:deoxyribonuclease-4
MIIIGAHISISEGFEKAAVTAKNMGANTYQYFTRNPRGGAAKEIDKKDISSALEYMKENSFKTLIAHAPYTLNLCSGEERVRQFGETIFKSDLQRLKYFPESYYNFHPGSRKEMPLDSAIEIIANVINSAADDGAENVVMLETMSGKGSEVGSAFEELREIIDRTSKKDLIGVCIDTCHIYSAGYDIVNDLDSVFTSFDNIVGIKYIKALHINDSANLFNSKKDRHAKLGEGTIGVDAIIRFVNHPAVKGLPMILETPNDLYGYADEIKILKDNYKY